MREYEIDCKLLEEIMFYRGIKHTPENVVKEPKKARGGIYRGIKHDAIEKTDAVSYTHLTLPTKA